jgi:hypothetical protein
MRHIYKDIEIEDAVYDDRGDLAYGVVRNIINESTASAMAEGLDEILENDSQLDDQCPSSPSTYNPFCYIQQQLIYYMNSFFKKNLCPTYNYARRYVGNETLAKHSDREACEYSMTLSLSREGGIWPFYAKYKDRPSSEILMNVGDCTIYRGCDVLHWRDANSYGTQHQTFLHYVDTNGPNKDHVYDGDYRRFFSESDPTLHLDCKPKPF